MEVLIEDERYFSDFTVIKIIAWYSCEIQFVKMNLFVKGSQRPEFCVIKKVNSEQFSEVTLSKQISAVSKFFVSIYYCTVDFDENMYKIFMEQCPNQDLFQMITLKIKSRSKFSVVYVLFQFRNLAYALYSIHKLGYAHRDIKPQNIFITENNFLKIGDFGVSKETVGEGPNSIKGTEQYLPKYIREQIGQERGTYTATHIDTYGLGLSFAEMLSTTFLYNQKKNERLSKIQEELEKLGLDRSCFDLIKKMINEDKVFQVDMQMAYEVIDNLLIAEIGKIQINSFVCYLCERNLVGDFITLTENCIHSIHFSCYREFLCCWPDYPYCPLCKSEILQSDLESLKDFLDIY